MRTRIKGCRFIIGISVTIRDRPSCSQDLVSIASIKRANLMSTMRVQYAEMNICSLIIGYVEVCFIEHIGEVYVGSHTSTSSNTFYFTAM